ncbi:hypothetical protein ACTFIU_009480 [Dictyostelium citrinum]
MNIKIILFFIILIKCYYSLEIILYIDFSSTKNYTNSECGGSIDIIEIDGKFYQQQPNNINGNSSSSSNINYPPCKSTSDAGNRARQFINKTIGNPYKNVSLIIEFQNLNWNNTAIFFSTGFGTISSFCFFDIRVYNEPDAIITFDATNSIRPLFEYQTFTKDQGLCDSTLPRMKLKNLIFINFKNTLCLYISNLKQAIDQPLPVVQFSSIKTINSNLFIIANGSDGIISTPIEVIIDNCTFSDSINLKSQKYPMIWNWYNKITINNCIFNNFDNIYPIIISNYNENTIIKNTIFKNIRIISDNIALINNYNTIDFYDKITIDSCKIYGFSVLVNRNYDGIVHKLNNILFNNSNIIYSTNKPEINYSPGIFTFIGNYGNNYIDYKSFGIYFNNITIESNNVISQSKPLMYVVNMSYINFSNFNILPTNYNFSSPPSSVSIFQTSIVTDLTPISISLDENSISLFTNSVQFCKSILNSIIKIQLNKFQKQLPKLSEQYIKQPCNLCTINYLILDENNNSSSGNSSSSINSDSSDSDSTNSVGINSDSNNSSNNSNHSESNGNSGENKNDNDRFNLIFLIPIIIGITIIVGLFISIFFIKKKKRLINEKASNEGEIGKGTLEKNIYVVGEIVLQELAVSE